MTRSIPALALVVGGLLFGCGGMPEEGETQEPQAGSEGNVSQSAVQTNLVSGVTVTYTPATDTFTVHDTLADGHSAVADIINHNTGSNTQCWNPNGAGTSKSCERNYPNKPVISFRACTGEYGPRRLVACSGWLTINSFAPEKK
ncbi:MULTISPECIES: hypothetical protein [Corallococcus]|uniref:Lipoprotein n=1 Tax=Corallococcus exiguus TaxID=83462 RepID=A0A7X5BUX1_9BACT|nr:MULTISPECIES: hypothetical protein [Corallococcus]NBC41627.1 hypothetical protein [Corallococcus exiguus]TNV66679.1 hypothetical protein FH620_05025 [Corallococcus exiguus]